MTAAERWLPVVGFEGAYEVSDMGRVRSLARQVRALGRRGVERTRLSPGRVLKLTPHVRSGHLLCSLWLAGTGFSAWVHRMVLEAFAGPCPEGMECRHLDGNPVNNELSNLVWGTRTENVADTKKHGRMFVARGELCGKAKLTAERVLEMRARRRGGALLSALAQDFGVTPQAAGWICSGKRWAWLKEEAA